MTIRSIENILVTTVLLSLGLFLGHCGSDGNGDGEAPSDSVDGGPAEGAARDAGDSGDSAPFVIVNPALITAGDVKCVGAWRTPVHTTSIISVSDPMAMRRTGGQRQYFLYGGAANDHVHTMLEPAQLAPCQTAVASLPVGKFEDDWGSFKVSEAENYVPGQGAAFAMGLNWDSVEERLVLNWAGTYSTSAAKHGFASASLNESSKTLTVRGCWGLKDQPTQRIGTGMLPIPAAWATANGLGDRRWAVGLGGHVGYTAGNSYGPTLFALKPPADNNCDVSAGNNLIPTADYTPLALFPWNEIGPRCHDDLGCTAGPAPTAPYAAKMAFNTYSGTYSSWEPYGGHGWYTVGTHFNMTWYDDGAKRGVLVPMRQQSGWINQQVSASPAPSVTGGGFYPVLNFTLPSLDTHDGHEINVGDWMWLQTCAPIDSPGCESENSRYLSQGSVVSVDRATKRVAIEAHNTDFTNGPHTPVVGGKALLGCYYAAGAPTCSRGVYRMQVIDPAEYAAVAAGTKTSNEPTYTSEFEITDLIPNHGSPASGSGVYDQGTYHSIVSVMPDPAAHQVLVAIGEEEGGVSFKSVYVWEIAH